MFLAFGLAHSFLTAPALAAADEVMAAQSELNEIIQITSSLTRSVEKLDEARLVVIRKTAEQVLQAIGTRGLGNFQTMRHYQQLIITFRYSISFFKQIETTSTERMVARLAAIGKQIEKARGFDDTPYTQITANVFNQQYRLFLQLKESTSLPADLHDRVNALVAPLANVIAIARQGDRPKTFAAARPMHAAIVALYGSFGDIERSNSAFNVILEIEGLNEFYAEYAQIDP